jgi:RNA polymerase sigma-70 factor, ECF subfamily
MPDPSTSSGTSTSRSLLAGARRAEPEAWERLAALYAPLVAYWCRRWGVAEQDIADIIQDVFSAVSLHLGTFQKDRPTDTFRGWLLTIARNKAHDHFRRCGHEPAAAGGTEAALRIQQILDPHRDDQPLESIRPEFHERTWQAFWSTVVEGRTAPDVAADLSMQPGTVRVAKSRVLLRLRRELGDQHG